MQWRPCFYHHIALQVAVSIQDGAQSIAAAALAAARAAASGTKHGQVSVMETRRFAGKDIQVTQIMHAALSLLENSLACLSKLNISWNYKHARACCASM